MREKLYSIQDSSKYIDKLGHPGYSGKHWNDGKIGKSYLKELSKYTYMACTTCNEGYELLKYIECAEIGSVPIGEVPPSLVGTEAEKYIIKIPDEVLVNNTEFDKWFSNINIDTKYTANKYRECIKDLRSKDRLKSNLLNNLNKNEIY